MIVCLCRGVRDAVVGAVIAEGAETVADIIAACDAGADCGGCHASLLGLLADRDPAVATR
jgi:bacterioferritin-associated ferredoxin